jgi:hypothetical protein
MTHDTNQKRTLAHFPPGADQTRSLKLPLRSNDYDRIEKENPLVGERGKPKKSGDEVKRRG